MKIPVLHRNSPQEPHQITWQKQASHTIRKKIIEEIMTHAPEIGKAAIQHPKTTIKTAKTGYKVYRGHRKVNQSIKGVMLHLSGNN